MDSISIRVKPEIETISFKNVSAIIPLKNGPKNVVDKFGRNFEPSSYSEIDLCLLFTDDINDCIRIGLLDGGLIVTNVREEEVVETQVVKAFLGDEDDFTSANFFSAFRVFTRLFFPIVLREDEQTREFDESDVEDIFFNIDVTDKDSYRVVSVVVKLKQ